jgi:hypothetical protein
MASDAAADQQPRRRRQHASPPPPPPSPSFLDTRATSWVSQFGEARSTSELERMVDRWSAEEMRGKRTLREAAAAATRLVALAERRAAGNGNGNGNAPLLLDRIARAISEPALAAVAPSPDNTHPSATGPAMSAAHLLWSHARLRWLPDGGGDNNSSLGAALLALAASGAGGRDATNPAAMALWASIRLAEAEQLQAHNNQQQQQGARRGGGRTAASAASSSSSWRPLARRARADFAALVLRHHAARLDFGSPTSGDHSNHFNMAVWSFATVGPPYSRDELRALEVLLRGAERFYGGGAGEAPPPSPGGAGSCSPSSSSPAAARTLDQAKPLVSLLVGLGRLNGDVLPAVSARGVVGGRESLGAGAGAAAAAAAQAKNGGDWRSLGSEAVAAAAATADRDESGLVDPFAEQKQRRRLTARAALAATAAAGDGADVALPQQSLRRALAGAASAAARALPAVLASHQRRYGSCDGQMLASAAWGLAMCADVYDARAMDALAAAVAAALLPASASASSTSSFRPEHFARLTWAFARKGHYAPAMMDAISRAAVPQMRAQAAEAEAAAAAAAPPPRAPAKPPLLLFSVQNLANLAWGAASLGYTRDASLYDAALACAAAPPPPPPLATAAAAKRAPPSRSRSPSPRPLSLLELDATPLHACNLLWSGASAAGGRAPAAFVAAAARAVAGWDAAQLPWSLGMQLLQAAGAGVEASQEEGEGGGGGGGGGSATSHLRRFALPDRAREVLLAAAERNKAPSIVSPFQGELAIAAAAATDLRWREWGRWLRQRQQEGASPPPPPPELEARPPGVLVGDVDVLVHWLPPPPTSSSGATAKRARRSSRSGEKEEEEERGLPLPPPPVAIALEADGPTHFARSPHAHPLGRTLVRNRTLRSAGLGVAVVPHWEWDRLEREVRQGMAEGGVAVATAGRKRSAVKSGGGWCAQERVALRVARLLDEAAQKGEVWWGDVFKD